MAIDTTYLAKLLANGVSQAQAAAAVGCTPSYVSQLVSADESMQQKLMAEEATLATAAIKKVESLASIEKDLLERVRELVPYSESLGEATTALQRIADMKDKRDISSSGGQRSGNVIELNLGKLADSKLEVEMGDNRVIMHLGGMNMARAPSSKVKELLQARKNSNAACKRAEDCDIWEIPATVSGGM